MAGHGHVSGNQANTIKYVYELPYTERKMLCNILDMDNQWERLGGEFMQFRVHELYEIRRAERCGESPCDRLLQAWGHQNNTVAMLYKLLYRMHHYQAMRVLLPFIPSKYHSLALQGEQSLTVVLPKLKSGATNVMSSSATTQLTTASSGAGSTVVVGAVALPKPPQHLLASVRHMTASGESSGRENPTLSIPGSECFHGNLDSPRVPSTPDGKVPADFLQPELHSDKIVNIDYVHSASAGVSCEENALAVAAHATVTDLDTQYREKAEAKLALLQLESPLHNAAPGAARVGTDNVRSAAERVTVVAADASIPETAPATNIAIMIETPSLPPSSPSLHPPSSSPTAPSPSPQAPSRASNSPNSRNRRISTASSVSVQSDSSASVPMIAYAELTAATGGWARASLLGRGGFGSVYRGTWKNTEVAVKRIHPQHSASALNAVPLCISQTLEELRLLQTYRHDNILQLYGFSADAGQPACLVYQFMMNGSVEDRLQCRRLALSDSGGSVPPALDWWQRLNIALGTAKALQFLHTVKEKPLIHGDIKSANILLDCNFEPKLGDFGLAREGPDGQYTSMMVSRVQGTRPYIPEEYLRDKKLSTKVDCYSYGVVLFELCTGLRAQEEKRQQKFLKELVCECDSGSSEEEALQDPKAGCDTVRIFSALMQIGRECVVRVAKKRPDMATLYERLQQFVRQDKDAAHRRLVQGSFASYASSLYAPGHPPLHYDTAGSLLLPSTSPSTPPTQYPSTNPFTSIHHSAHPSIPHFPSSASSSASPHLGNHFAAQQKQQHYLHHPQYSYHPQHHLQHSPHHPYVSPVGSQHVSSMPAADNRGDMTPSPVMHQQYHNMLHYHAPTALRLAHQHNHSPAQLHHGPNLMTGIAPGMFNLAPNPYQQQQQHIYQQQQYYLQQQARQRLFTRHQHPAAVAPVINVSPPSKGDFSHNRVAGNSTASSVSEAALPDLTGLQLQYADVKGLSAGTAASNDSSKHTMHGVSPIESQSKYGGRDVSTPELSLPMNFDEQRQGQAHHGTYRPVMFQPPGLGAGDSYAFQQANRPQVRNMAVHYNDRQTATPVLPLVINEVSVTGFNLDSDSEALLPMLTVLGNKSSSDVISTVPVSDTREISCASAMVDDDSTGDSSSSSNSSDGGRDGDGVSALASLDEGVTTSFVPPESVLGVGVTGAAHCSAISEGLVLDEGVIAATGPCDGVELNDTVLNTSSVGAVTAKGKASFLD